MAGSRFQTAADKTKALRQYEQLRRSGMVVKAVVIAELKTGDFHILGQNLIPSEIARMLVVAAQALEQADGDRKLVRLVARVEPDTPGVRNGSPPRAKRITKGPDGILVPPKGENFISCGECGHPQFHVLHNTETDLTSRYACSHCGNEVENLMITHAPGWA